MRVGLCLHAIFIIQEVDTLKEKLKAAKDEEEKEVITLELDITETRRQLADSRRVRLHLSLYL